MITGYRYATDKQRKYWIVKLSTAKEEPARHNVPGYENEFVSDDCTCEAITEIETGEEAKSMILKGVLGRPIEYTVGEKIGGLCWYCHSIEDLYKNYLHRSKGKNSGKTYHPFILANKMDYMITEVYGRTYEEVAARMKITPEKLIEQVQSLKEGLGEEEDEALYMPILITLQRMEKKK